MSAVQAFLQHLQVERRMSAHTLDAYRRDLDALSAWAEPRGVAVEALDADALILPTEWKEFRLPNWGVLKKIMRRHVVIDGRNIYNGEELTSLGFTYYGIGQK